MAVAVGFRRRLQTGPALRISRIPLGSLTLSAILHAVLIASAVVAVNAIKESQPKVYVVNLVPAIPAIGRPEGQGSTPAPPRPEPPPPAAEPAPPTELPPRTPSVPDMPPRQRARESVGLPERSALPPRTTAPATTPRPVQKELPPVASATSPAAPVTPAPPRETAGTPPPPPLGVAVGGSPHGKGKLSIEVDFPYAWYVKILHEKITERWDRHANRGHQPLIAFEIGRKGEVDPARVVVKQSSGNRHYDQLAVRSIVEAAPFPPLPDDFKDQRVTIVIQFRHAEERG